MNGENAMAICVFAPGCRPDRRVWLHGGEVYDLPANAVTGNPTKYEYVFEANANDVLSAFAKSQHE